MLVNYCPLGLSTVGRDSQHMRGLIVFPPPPVWQGMELMHLGSRVGVGLPKKHSRL